MSEQIEKGRSRVIHVYLPKKEYDSIVEQALNSSNQNVSAYCRKLLLYRSPTIFYRNRSLDDFMEEMILLRKELTGIANALRNPIIKNPASDHVPGNQDWVIGRESMENNLLKKLEQIKIKIYTISDQWLR